MRRQNPEEQESSRVELREGRLRKDRTQGIRNPGRMEPRKQNPGWGSMRGQDFQEGGVRFGMGQVVQEDMRWITGD